MDLINTLFNIRGLVNHYLKNNDTEGFGCACNPAEPYIVCGPCTEAKRQQALMQAVKLINEAIEGVVPSEEEAYSEACKSTMPPLPEASIGRWWFHKGYQHLGKIKAVAWREAIIDELMTLHVYSEKHDADPKAALNAIISTNVDIALDPQVSSDAQALIDKGYKKGLEDGILQGKDLAAREALMR